MAAMKHVDIHEFLIRVLPWPTDECDSGYINLHWSQPSRDDPKRRFWSGRPYRDAAQMLGMAKWVVQNIRYADVYFCMSRQLHTSTNRGKTIAQRSAANATLLKSL
jgi:hypothetical protein